MTAGHEFLYQFGPFTVSGRERVLLREGVPVSLAPKALDILLVLVRNSGHLVAKDQLMAEVWPETYVEESNLTQNISVLRKVLDEDSLGSSCIETVPRRGYRFLAPVTRAPEVQPLSGADTETCSATVEKVYRLLAILPFDNASNDPQMDYLSDGITESIISSLSHLPQLRVMSRNAVSRFKGHDIDAQCIGRELGVDAVLLGRVQLLDGRLLISTELVDVANGWQLWGENYDRESKAILELQDEIARQIFTKLKLKLTGEDEQQLTRRYTESADAYQAYLQGRYQWSAFTREGLEQATIFFGEAINLDPNYALAYAGIVDCYLRLASNYIPPIEIHMKEQKDRQWNEVEKVQEPIKTRYRWDWTGAERELKRANELKSNYPAAHQWHAAYLFSRSLFEEAQRRIQTKGQGSRARNDVGPYSKRVMEHIRFVTPTRAEETQIFCTIARDQIEVGNYEGACQILSGLLKVGEWPQLDGLSSYSAGDLLFTAGTLTGRLARSRQMTVGQKLAEALLNGSIGIFESLGLRRRSAEAQIELADCYYYEGLFDLARQTLVSALRSLGDQADLELRTLAQLRLGIVERHSGRLHEALASLTEAAEVVDLVGPWITGRYHLETATTLKNLAAAETNEKFFSAAVEHYQSALSEFEAIGNHRYVGIVKNNHGFLLLGLGQYQESLQHLLRARNLFESLGDPMSSAQVDDTLARLHIAQGDFEAGNEAISRAIQVLQTCDSEALLSEALVTSGLILAKLGRRSEAKRVLDHASQLAERCGYTDGLARAFLTMIEEIPETLFEDEKRELAVRIHKLTHTQQSEYQKGRLTNCLNRLRDS
jgi:TolB-like protein